MHTRTSSGPGRTARIGALAGSLAASLAGVLVLGAAPAATAHGDTLKVVVVGHRDGRVLTEVTWENDGDQVEEAVAATVNAVSADGTRTAGPWRLVRAPGGSGPGGGWTTAEALPAGNWKVTVEAGFPGLGRAERELTVAPQAGRPPAATSPAAVSPTPTADPERVRQQRQDQARAQAQAQGVQAGSGDGTDSGPGAGALTAAGFAVAAVAGAGVGLWIRRSRSRRR
ncbi:hypothetical protein [Streptomyces sp. NPDC012888]|uniref:hypothetical protein n=1 Tax=Streptomyces sp. NPDC012888 TaxID=3364855 RepID=UPI0036C320BE